MSTKKQNREVVTNSSFETQKLGYFFAKNILKIQSQEKAIVVALQGELGSGKTTFLQGFAKGLGVKHRVVSPTFVIMKKFLIPKRGFEYFFHFDCYRIEDPKEILILGFEKIVSNPKNIVCIEWPEKIKSVLPRGIIRLRFLLGNNKNQRKILFNDNFTGGDPL